MHERAATDVPHPQRDPNWRIMLKCASNIRDLQDKCTRTAHPKCTSTHVEGQPLAKVSLLGARSRGLVGFSSWFPNVYGVHKEYVGNTIME